MNLYLGPELQLLFYVYIMSPLSLLIQLIFVEHLLCVTPRCCCCRGNKNELKGKIKSPPPKSFHSAGEIKHLDDLGRKVSISQHSKCYDWKKLREHPEKDLLSEMRRLIEAPCNVGKTSPGTHCTGGVLLLSLKPVA